MTAEPKATGAPGFGGIFGFRLSGTAKVWILNAFIFGLSGALCLYARSLDELKEPFSVPWWLIGVLFFISESNVVHFEFRRNAHSFSLSEIPLVIGLFFASPLELFIGQAIGSLIALTVSRRQTPVKAVFNLGNFCLQTVLAVIVFHSVLHLGDPVGPAGWLASFLATSAATVEGVASIALVISLSGEGVGPRVLATRVLGLGLLVTMTNTSLALVGVTTAWVEPRLMWILAVPAITLFVAYRGYTVQRRKRESMELLHTATRVSHGSMRMDEMMLFLLGQARDMFTADVAEVTFFPEDGSDEALRTTLGPGAQRETMHPMVLDPTEGVWARVAAEGEAVLLQRPIENPQLNSYFAARGIEDAMVAPLHSEHGVVGTMLIANHLGDVSTFDREDLRLFETLANHASVSLDNARLVSRLEDSLAHLTEMNRLKEDFVASVSHELRTPLTGIQGYVKTLIRSHHKLDAEQTGSFLHIIDRQGDRLRALIEDLLAVSRIESGGDSGLFEAVDLGTLTRSIVEELSPRTRKQELISAVAAPVPALVTDAGKVHQIVTNLLENAIKYSPENTTITLSARAEGAGVLISVDDQGGGIPADMQDKIFDRFFQVDQSSTREVGGTGLGLYICRRLAEVLGGRIWLERSDEHGSAFSLWLPSRPPEAGPGKAARHPRGMAENDNG